jgi:hypothetical protein
MFFLFFFLLFLTIQEFIQPVKRPNNAIYLKAQNVTLQFVNKQFSLTFT